MHKRYTSPPLLWSLAQDYAAKKWPDHPISQSDLRLYLYAEGGGAWLMHGPRLYWQDSPDPGAPFTTAPADALAGAEIADVVLMHLRLRQSARWDSLDDAVRGMREGKTGRPPIDDSGPMTAEVTVRMTSAMRQAIPGDVSAWIRQAIADRIDK